MPPRLHAPPRVAYHCDGLVFLTLPLLLMTSGVTTGDAASPRIEVTKNIPSHGPIHDLLAR